MTKNDYRARTERSWYMSRSRSMSLYEWALDNPVRVKTKATGKRKNNSTWSRGKKRIVRQIVDKLRELTALVESIVDS